MANKKTIYHAAVRTIVLVPTRSEPTMRRSHRMVLSRSGQECLAGGVCVEAVVYHTIFALACQL
jgi:hypothetical protein